MSGFDEASQFVDGDESYVLAAAPMNDDRLTRIGGLVE
jgi:hypothetical protein